MNKENIKVPRRYEREINALGVQISGLRSENESLQYQISKNDKIIEQLEHQIESIYNTIKKEETDA
jgi:predicted RNase H-like nuclease (RuvC/YqgF family)